MGCFGSRRRDDYWGHMRAEQKWDYINLNDFKSTSCFTQFSYVILWITVFISMAVYGVDIFTCVNLLAFNRWSTERKQLIPRHISKWIFAGCIMLSFVFLIYRWIRAVRVIKQGGVAQSYLDPLAVRIQSIRAGEKGQGWRRFLVFYELTKSKKGADYVALFTYFNFEAWMRVVFAEGPRQFINATILYSVMETDLILQGDHAAPEGTSSVSQFFENIQTLADKDQRQAVILSAMLFTLVIWVFSVLSLIVSCVLYLLFLWHHIPSEDGSLTAYCRRKINRRFERIVKQKVDKALAKDVMLQDRQPTDPELGNGFKRQPTLPTFGQESSDKGADMPGLLSRQTTTTTLPSYSRPSTTRSNSQRQPVLPELNWTNEDIAMGSSHHSRLSDDDLPLVNNAGGFAYDNEPRYTPGPSVATPLERQGTPLSLMTGVRPQDTRSPGMNSPAPNGQYPFPPTMAVDRSQGRSITPGRPFAPQPPPNGSGYLPFPGSPGPRSPGPRSPSAGITPGPTPFRNFARPSTTSPSNEYGNRSVSDQLWPQRTGTAPPQNQSPYSPF
ncbi:hypothetical protein AJ79_03133 [Helicocarpus griseus UAMH5409]|uniref:Pheromone-regulated membrane protein 6 n=1 Tax=Helicocarpus griseus UAMH5409 TaxID=1447875 RepID=A0A2B7XZW1_9EURO|nr:hypothetical protein AJ79_03133 [Helicocarpus griseus UAMH5409]